MVNMFLGERCHIKKYPLCENSLGRDVAMPTAIHPTQPLTPVQTL